MWFLLVVALGTGEYRAEIIYKDEATCVANKTTAEDLCVPVQVAFAPEQTPSS
jgi:hypothetical protein